MCTYTPITKAWLQRIARLAGDIRGSVEPGGISVITLQHMHHQDGAQGTAKRGFLFRVVSVMALAMMLIAAFGVAHPNVTRAGQAGTINTNNVEIFQHPTNLT